MIYLIRMTNLTKNKGEFMDMNKMTTARNWDNSKIQVRMKDLHEWTMWDRYNRKNQIHPMQSEFTEKEFIKDHVDGGTK